LSYTRFEYSKLAIEPASIGPGGKARIHFTVRNTGTRAGDEVPQLYVKPATSPVAQPVMALKAFGRVHLAAGEEREVSFTLDARDLRALDERMRLGLPTGTLTLLVGASSNDIRLRGSLSTRTK